MRTRLSVIDHFQTPQAPKKTSRGGGSKMQIKYLYQYFIFSCTVYDNVNYEMCIYQGETSCKALLFIIVHYCIQQKKENLVKIKSLFLQKIHRPLYRDFCYVYHGINTRVHYRVNKSKCLSTLHISENSDQITKLGPATFISNLRF